MYNLQYLLVEYAFLIWMIVWKGIALWRAAKYNQRNWFIAILIFFVPVPSFGIIEIIYLFKFAKHPMTMQEIQSWFKNTFFSKEDKKSSK
jgi:methionyl-tRNA synthetase